MISLLSFLSSLWTTSRANLSLSLSLSLSLCEWLHPPVLRVASSSSSRTGGLTDLKMGQAGRPGRPIGLGPSQPASVAPSPTWVLLAFCTLSPSIASYWRCHPRVQDRGFSRTKFGLLRFNPQGCSFVTLRSLPPLGVISSCT
jgi:hypothetical protein